MLEIISYIGLLLALVIAVVLFLASRKSDTFSHQRTMRIAAAPERIFPHIASQRALNVWNPFVEPDPNIKLDYSGPQSGVGSRCAWSGNGQVGRGHIEIVEARPNERVVMRLVMVKPMAADNQVVFTLTPEGNGTAVTWAMSGTRPFLPKVMDVVMNCDRMVGGTFEKGLGKLKRIVETA